MTDADLVARARQGDTAAFGELVDRHRAAVFRAALAALGSRADAEDAAQDAFLLAYRRLNTFRGESSFKTWLLTIAWHQAINRRRSLVKMWRRMVDTHWHADSADGHGEPIVMSIASSDPTPEKTARDRELARAVRQEIGALPARLRDALLLAQAGNYSYEEIAAMLKAPLGTIKWRVSEARRVIKRRLAERGHIDRA